jgi:hypothetical protein
LSHAAERTDETRGDDMVGAEPTVERQELSERLLGIIGGYAMGTALDAQDLMRTAPGALAPDGIRVAGDGDARVPDGGRDATDIARDD